MDYDICPKCGKQKGKEFPMCAECHAKKFEGKEESKNEIVDQLQKQNNNLYAIRTILEFNLFQLHNKKLVWKQAKGEELGRFVIE